MAEKKARSSPKKTAQKITDAAFAVMAEKSWRDWQLSDVAVRAGVPLADVQKVFHDKLAVNTALHHHITQLALRNTPDDLQNESEKDRLFEVIMSRFEVMGAYKATLHNIVRATFTDPQLWCANMSLLLNLSEWFLAAADIKKNNLEQMVIRNSLVAVYLYVLRTWWKDNAPDQAKTMASLDRALTQLETFLQAVPSIKK